MFKNKYFALGIGVTAIVVVILAFVLGLLLVKLLWAWVVKDLFPGAVEQGLIAEKISWWGSFKVALVLALLSALWGRGGYHRE